jgi:hypothetical protein
MRQLNTKMDEVMEGTAINAENLRRKGYKEYPPGMDTYTRLFQRPVRDEQGRLYFVNFREWQFRGTTSYDAQLACDTGSGGHVWATIKEETIEATEVRAAQLWEASGAVRYDN